MTETTRTNQLAETLASIRDHYEDAVNRGDRARAGKLAAQYERITGKFINED